MSEGGGVAVSGDGSDPVSENGGVNGLGGGVGAGGGFNGLGGGVGAGGGDGLGVVALTTKEGRRPRNGIDGQGSG